MSHKLYRSGREKMLGGVAGGLADYFEVDVTLVRLIMLVTLLAGGVGLFVYIAAWIIVPLNPEHGNRPKIDGEPYLPEIKRDELDSEERLRRKEKNRQMAGYILIGLGVMIFFDRMFSWFRWERMWPLVLIGIGVLILARGNNGGKKG